MTNTPRWLREHRRRIAECERFPLRLVVPHSHQPPDFSWGQMWSIPEPMSIQTRKPKRRLRGSR